MRKLLVLCVMVLSCSFVATAQSNLLRSAASDPTSSPARPPQYPSPEIYHWQVAITYEFLHFDAPGSAINLNGFNTSVTKLVTNHFGLEADVGPAWGTAATKQTAKLLWYGGGAHYIFRRNEKIEPWAHALFGGAHFFPQTAFGNNTYGYIAGGGADLRLNPRVSWRVQGDLVGTHFFSLWQKSVQFKTGLAFNF